MAVEVDKMFSGYHTCQLVTNHRRLMTISGLRSRLWWWFLKRRWFLTNWYVTVTWACCNRPWRPIGLWDVEAPTFPRQSAHRWRWGCQPYAPTDRPLPPGRFLVLISLRGWVDSRAIVRLEGLGRLKNPVTLTGIEPATFRACSIVPQPTTLQQNCGRQ
jgi:hypothetical protein